MEWYQGFQWAEPPSGQPKLELKEPPNFGWWGTLFLPSSGGILSSEPPCSLEILGSSNSMELDDKVDTKFLGQ